jgi:poly(3-hydroxybutyrate) depolymerase
MKRVLFNFCRLFSASLAIMLITSTLNAQVEPLLVGTTTRNMLVYAPSGIEPGRPLMISMHGYNQDITYQRNQTKWETYAEANSFVIVYPAGLNNAWDISGMTDIDFILAIIDEMYDRYAIDRNRVYLSGFSMGGMMTYYAATKIADKIAAFAPVSGYPMGGTTNTNSSRPVPIIHIHGTTDDVVAFSGVQACLDAWIARNNCPTTPVITNPYPSIYATSNGTKYAWGPGTDNVQVVLLKLQGVGHWHSIATSNGVNTTQEIWDFCKNFSLGFGIPEFGSAYVGNDNPKQIELTLTESVKDSGTFSGFTVKVDSQIVVVDSIALSDTNQLTIYLQDIILKENEITLSYESGDVFSIYNKALENFGDTLVENFIYGSAPRIIEFSIIENGDTLIGEFNKKMQIPADISTLRLHGDLNDTLEIPISGGSFLGNDSSKIVFSIDEQVFADYDLYVSYSGNSIISADSGILKTFTDFPVINNSIGLPVYIDSAEVSTDSYTLTLYFTKPMILNQTQMSQFIFECNDQVIPFRGFSSSTNTLRFMLSSNIHFEDVLSISYTPGTILAADGGALESFSDFPVENPLTAPSWTIIPGRIEAENYTYQSGVSTETTSDAGGGLNVGWIEKNDWMEYAIDNTSSDTSYQISFRLASPNSGKAFRLYLDNELISTISVPNTSDWQVFRSVSENISIGSGKHYLKLVAATDGFNINYFVIGLPSSLAQTDDDPILIVPNPVSDFINIISSDFQYNTIELLDVMGRQVLIKTIEFNPEYSMPVNLLNGSYYMRISNENQVKVKRITVVNN